MITDTITRILTSRAGKLLLLLVILGVAATQAVPYMVDSKVYVERLTQFARQKTGGTLVVKGGSSVKLLPRPTLTLSMVELSQPNVERSPSLIADSVEIGVDTFSLLGGGMQVSHVKMAGVSFVTEEAADGTAHWGFLGLPFLKELSGGKSAAPIQFELVGGRAAIANAAQGTSRNLSNISLFGTLGENTALQGAVTYDTSPVQFNFTRNGTLGATPFTLMADAGSGNMFSMNGNMDFTADHPVVTAKMELNAADISAMLKKPQAPANTTPEQPVATATDPIPLKLSADYTQKEGLISLSNMAFEMQGSKSVGMLEWPLEKGTAKKLDLQFSELDLSLVKNLFAMYRAAPKADVRGPQTLFDKALNIALDIKADRVKNGTQNWSNVNMNAAVADGVLTVNQLSIRMPGESEIGIFGLLSVSDTQGLRFEGNAEAKGASLRELLTVFDESATNLPQIGFGAFKLRSNLFISSELMRLSEAEAQFSELSLRGGLVAYFDGKPRVEAQIGLRDINFDYFRDSWRASAPVSESDNVFLRFDRNMNFDWLKKLGATIDFKVDVQGFTFLERKGQAASLRLFAQANEVGIYNAKFNYGTDTTEANVKLDVSKGEPNLNLVLNTNELNTNYFARVPVAAEPVKVEAPIAPAKAPAEAMPDMVMPDVTPEEELRQKIEEEAAGMEGMAGTPAQAAPLAEAVPATPAASSNITITDPEATNTEIPATTEETLPVELSPLSPDGVDMEAMAADDTASTAPAPTDVIDTIVETAPQSLLIGDASAQEIAPAAPAESVPPVEIGASAPTAGNAPASSFWSEELIDMGFMEGIGGTFDISVGKLQHKNLVLQNFKMLAKLERNLLTFQTLTFAYWGGSFSVNGTVFGGKVPGLSLGFIIASADTQKMLSSLLGINSIGGKVSISGTLDTSGVNLLSWISQATAKTLVAGRGVTMQGFDMQSVISAVSASRTAADVFNNVNLSIVGGSGEYSVDGAINLQKGILSTPGIAMKTGRVIGNLTGDFRLIPWDINVTGIFKFPELATENVPTMTVRWSGPVDHPSLQTDTQSLEALVSKRIIGN